MLDRHGAGGLTDMSYDRTQVKAKLATLISNLKLKLRPGELDRLTDDMLALEQPAVDAMMRVNVNDPVALKYMKSRLSKLVRRESADDLISRVLEGESVDELVGELIIGVQTPPPPMTDKERKKKRMGAGIEPESNKSTYYPMEPGSQGWFET